MRSVACPYCQRAAKLVTGAEVYPHRSDLARRQFWSCQDCKAYVGCHQAGDWIYSADGRKVISDGALPLGRLANAELRAAKSAAHEDFDLLWNNAPDRYKARTAAYAWLAEQLYIPVAQCPIGEFDVALCKRVVEVCEPRLMQMLEEF